MLEKGKDRSELFGSAAQWILWTLIFGLSVLPLVKTVKEFITRVAVTTKAYVLIEQFVVPPMARMIGSILRYVFGVETVVNTGSIFLLTRGLPYELYLSWNCVGWQSMVLLLISLMAGLQGNHSLRSKLKCVVFGVEGVVVVNLLRVVVSAMILLKWGYWPAITFHDHVGLVVTYVWLGAFWYISNTFILEPSAEAETKPLHERMKEAVNGLKLRSFLPDFIYGRRAMGLATMAIILTMTALSGIAVLSADVLGGSDPTILSFEYVDPSVTVNGITTNRILPLQSDLGTTYTDDFTPAHKHVWYDAWDFYLCGPLEEDYTLTGQIVFKMYFYASEDGEVNIRFYIYDVDENGDDTYVAHYDEERELEDESPDDPLVYVTEYIDPHTFSAGHTIQVKIKIRTSNPDTTYYFDYDSNEKHSRIEFPGIVVPESVLQLTMFAPLIPIAVSKMRKRRDE